MILHGDPPKFTFSLTLFRDLTISCYRGNTKISCNDLINGFTYKFEKYWQILEVLKRLGTSERNVQEEIKHTAMDLNNNINSEDMEEERRIKLIDQLMLQSKKLHGQRYDASMMKTTICLYLRSRNCYSGKLGSQGECENTNNLFSLS